MADRSKDKDRTRQPPQRQQQNDRSRQQEQQSDRSRQQGERGPDEDRYRSDF